MSKFPNIFTTRIRRMRQGNVFSHVYLSDGGGCLSSDAPSQLHPMMPCEGGGGLPGQDKPDCTTTTQTGET